MKTLLLYIFFLVPQILIAQRSATVTVKDAATKLPLPYANARAGGKAIMADASGKLQLQVQHHLTIAISATGYKTDTLTLDESKNNVVVFLQSTDKVLDEVVVTGNMREMSKLESPVPVEVFTPKYFQKNPTACLFDAVGMINGVRPQLNCNICNTGDIHINGMEGPYTMVLIDGMPIVSALSSVYGLSGIPNSIVERVEVVKGPASSLYGSEAMGGIINVVTKNAAKAPLLSIDAFGTTWQEYNMDAGVKMKLKKAQSLLGINYYNYQHPVDNNGDGFTDVTQQNRISIFNKWNVERKENRLASFAARYVYEDRWGGQMNWSPKWRGTDSIYGESIYTNRIELTGMYQLPLKEKIMLQLSYNKHDQDSRYGDKSYIATQKVSFAQLYWDKQLNAKHQLLLGASYRYTWYDDNTPATASADSLHPQNMPAKTPLPGVFVQDEWSINAKHKLLFGYRYDYDKTHGNIHSPRIAYRYSPGTMSALRASIGTGFRVVNLFTEDHAALTGSRQVVIAEALKPERSYAANLNYTQVVHLGITRVEFDVSAFYTYFTNKITGDYNTDPDKIIYANLHGHAISRGGSINTSITFPFPLKLLIGTTYMDVFQVNDNKGVMEKSEQLFAPKWSGNFVIGYTLPAQFTVDFTGQWNGPMRLPLQPKDFRPEYSPWFCLANIQITKKITKDFEVYGGVKNLFNFVPKDVLMRPFDPFDKHVNDPVNNPNGYTFDTEYNYAPLQGVKGFLGARLII